MLVIRPQSGLANRLRALDSAVGLAARWGCPLHVLWVRTPELNAPFSSLFRLGDAFTVAERFSLIRDNGRAQLLSRKLLREAYLRRFSAFKSIIFHDEVIRRVREKKGFGDLAEALPAYIESNWRFHPSPDPYCWLAPTPSIAAAVEAHTAAFDDRTIGVHIRRRDNRQSIRHSPTEAFIEVMESALGEDPRTHFFLATDSPAEETRLRLRFGERILSRSRKLSRLHTSGLRDALVDLLLLSRTSRIIGSHWSSFSGVAAEIGRIPHTPVFRS